MAYIGGGQSAPAVDHNYQNGRSLIESPPAMISDLRDQLTGIENYDIWRSQVVNKLKTMGCDQSIDISIPRPAPNTPGFELWEDWSIFISSWLIGQVSPQVCRTLYGKVSEIYYADETYEHIHKAVLDEAPRKRKGVASKLHNMRRVYHASVSQYIEDLMKTCDLAHRSDCGYEPYFAAIVLLINLRPGMPEWCDIIDQHLEGYNNLNYTADQFHDLCMEASAKAEIAELSAFSEISSRNRKKQRSNKKKAA